MGEVFVTFFGGFLCLSFWFLKFSSAMWAGGSTALVAPLGRNLKYCRTGCFHVCLMRWNAEAHANDHFAFCFGKRYCRCSVPLCRQRKHDDRNSRSAMLPLTLRSTPFSFLQGMSKLDSTVVLPRKVGRVYAKVTKEYMCAKKECHEKQKYSFQANRLSGERIVRMQIWQH